MKMRTLKIRGIVGNAILVLMSALMISFIFMPMLADKNGVQVFSIAESMFDMNNITQILGDNSLYYILAGAFMIAYLIFSIALFVMAVISLVGSCLDKPRLSLAIGTRALSLAAAVVSSISIIFLVFYHQSSGVTSTTFGYGVFVALALSFIAIASSFVAPTKRHLFKVLENM